jgi:hypothetical protein
MEVSRLNAQLTTQVSQFNSQMDYNAEQWNAANAQAVEQSNITWRRGANTAETAAQNAANQQTAAFLFDMDKTTQSQMWQQLRDRSTFDFQREQSERDRMINVANAALGNESFMTDDKFKIQRAALFKMLDNAAESVTTGKSAGAFNIDTDGDGIMDAYYDDNENLDIQV